MGSVLADVDSFEKFSESVPFAEGLACDRMGDAPSVEELEAEMVAMPHLAADGCQDGDRATTHICRDVRQVRTAAEHIGRLPDPLDAFHLITNGRYALWDMVGAVADLAAPCTIGAIHLATLGFSRKNVDEMMAMMDAGMIGRLRLLCSHYFKGTSGGIWEHAAERLAKRPGASFLSIRNHAKIVALRLSDGRTLTIEASANLRSCKNIEQMSIFGHPDIYRFHTGWMDGLFSAAGVQ
jgi:hypothetical protein